MKQDIILAAKGLQAGYGERMIVRDVDLQVQRGDILSIIGPNGSGKSTLLKAMARLLPLNKGQVLLHGKDMHELPEKQIARMMAVMPQSMDFPADITVRELVSLGRMPYRGLFDAFGAKDKAVVDRVLALTNLADYQQRSIMALSGGERQRARLAMALAQEPELLLLDEPTTYLDIRHQLDLMLLIKSLHEKLGLTVAMVLHDLNHVARFSSRIVALQKGKIVADGSVQEVFKEKLIAALYGVENTVMELDAAGEKYLICLPHGVRSA